MPDAHDTTIKTITAALAETLALWVEHRPGTAVDETLAALTAAGYAVVKLPDAVAVEHGALLVEFGDIEADGDSLPLYVIEATP